MGTSQSLGQTAAALCAGLRRPAWISAGVNQVAVLVRDGSRSMAGRKARDACAASEALVEELARPVNKDGFWVAMVDFKDVAKAVAPLDRATALHGCVPVLDATHGWTNITAGLELAGAILRDSRAREVDGLEFLRPVVLCYTDGRHTKGPDPLPAAKALRQSADLVTIAFGDDADESLMREIASTPEHFYRCASGRELRAFLAAVGATLTRTLAARGNATNALTRIQ